MKRSMPLNTQATSVGIKNEHVCTQDYRGKHIICRTFGGNQQYKLAWVTLKTPFLKAITKCSGLPQQSADLIIGNVRRVKEWVETMIQK